MRSGGFLHGDHCGNFLEQLMRIVDDAVLDDIFDAADMVDLPIRLEPVESGSIKRLEVLQRILRGDNEVRQLARLDKSDRRLDPFGPVKLLRAVPSRRFDDFERTKP